MAWIISNDKYVFEVKVATDMEYSSNKSLLLFGRKKDSIPFTYMCKWSWTGHDITEEETENQVVEYLKQRGYINRDEEYSVLHCTYNTECRYPVMCGGGE